MRKALLFTLDMMLSIVIFGLFLSLISSFFIESNFDTYLISSYGYDCLRVIDTYPMNESKLKESFDSCLPDQLSYNLVVDFYDNNGNLVKEVVIGDSLPYDYAVVRRNFYYNNSFGVVSLRLWI